MKIQNLAYLWMKDSGGEKEYNFGGKYIFEKNTQQITVKENPTYIPNYFSVDNNNITEITGIVGKNGEGKTRLFRFIRNHVIHYKKTEEKTTIPFFLFLTLMKRHWYTKPIKNLFHLIE